jgi:hypothetical protein
MKLERPVTIKNPKRAWVLSRRCWAAPDVPTFYNYEFGIRILARPVAGR